MENYELLIWLFWKWEASSKNNANTCLVRRQQLRARVSFFYLLIGMFLIAFINSWCHRMSWQSQSQFAVEICLVTAWHRLLWKQLPLCVVANEKWYSCWLFWFCGCLIGVQTEEVSAQKKVVMKIKRHLQKQWKHYRFNQLVAKNSYRKRSWK